MPPKSFII